MRQDAAYGFAPIFGRRRRALRVTLRLFLAAFEAEIVVADVATGLSSLRTRPIAQRALGEEHHYSGPGGPL